MSWYTDVVIAHKGNITQFLRTEESTKIHLVVW